MKAEIINFRGIKRASIDLSKIALVIGKNGAGKTSVARSVAAALTGNALPFAGMTKKEATKFVTDGQEGGQVCLSIESGMVAITWPNCSVNIEGKPAFASSIATGLERFTSLNDKERSALLNSVLKSSPTIKEVEEAFKKEGFLENIIDDVCNSLKAMGWQATHAKYKESVTKGKGAWEHVAGEKYGSDKAPRWTPPGYHAHDTVESLQAAVDQAKAAYEAGLKSGAVSAHDQEKMREEAAQLEALQEKLRLAALKMEETQKAFQEHEKVMLSTPRPADESKEMDCPHCGCVVQLSATSGSSFMLLKSEPVPDNIRKETQKNYAAACGALENLKAQYNAAKREHDLCFSQVDKATAARQKLAKATDAPAEPVDTEVLRKAVAEAEEKLKNHNRYHEALKIAMRIEGESKITALLADDGLRMQKLTQVLEAFNTMRLAPLCEAFGAAPVTINGEMQCYLGSRPFDLLSASEQFRVNAVLQLAIAQLDGSQAVIMDEADILDKRGRGGLLKMLAVSGLPALVCMTMNDASQAPNLAAMGAGVTYWIEGGVANPIAAQGAQAA